MTNTCHDNRDPLKLVRDGTSQEQRSFQALDPAYVPVNERTVAHGMVFVRQYAAFLRLFNEQNLPAGSWQKLFSEDVSVQLAIAAVQDVDTYRQEIKRYFDFLNDLAHDAPAEETNCKHRLGCLFSSVASLAARLDELKETLPPDNRLRGVLGNIIKTQLAPHFRQFWAYFKHDDTLGANRLIADVPATTGPSGSPLVLRILGSPARSAATVSAQSFSTDWIPAGEPQTAWPAFFSAIAAENGYGAGGSVFTRINRLSTHNLFTAIFDQFLRAYARSVAEAKLTLEDSFTRYDNHAPHYALFIAFLHLLEHARAEANTLTGRHLDYYYKKVLRLHEKPAVPGRAHLLAQLAKHAAAHELPAGEKFAAGKDDLGRDAFFKNDRDFVANKAKVTALKTVYRHPAKVNDLGDPVVPLESAEPATDEVNKTKPAGRIFAAPISNSADGLGAELTSADQSWHPFFNKLYTDGQLSAIAMPTAEVGFALASHYLLLAGGTRTITLSFDGLSVVGQQKAKIRCLFSTEEGWSEAEANSFTGKDLQVALNGSFPPVVPYSTKVHGYGFDTNLPVMLVLLKHDGASEFLYHDLQDAVTSQITLTTNVTGLQALAVSNDFGPVDTSKPFQPFGAQPLANSSLVVGSKEVFQKALSSASVKLTWQNAPDTRFASPDTQVSYLNSGNWSTPGDATALGTGMAKVVALANGNSTAKDFPDLTENEHYHTAARHGFVRLSLSTDFGQTAYQTQLLNFLNKVSGVTNPGTPPLGPFATAITLDYNAGQTIALSSGSAADFDKRRAKFFHIAPFGHAEQHPALTGKSNVCLLPQFEFPRAGAKQETEAELYIGISGLVPPQNLALLFQVADGTANPLAEKPPQHLHWSYLQNNLWTPFEQNDLEDGTGGLLRSGIVTLAVPRDANSDNTLLPAGSHWIRLAVGSGSDAVCRLRLVAAQALSATFADAGNDPAFPAKTLPAGTISQLDQPDAAVKTMVQPFETFGGRGQESAAAFYTRIGERLRHKDRTVALWDYERLVLEAFPQVYRAKCLPHTQFQPARAAKPATATQSAQSAEPAKYRELAPGHVTLVLVPNQQQHNLRDPLRPYASLGLLTEVEAFLRARTTCFATLHVRNPQFEEVNTEFRVRLMPGYDEAFYVKKLQQEITRFLSPWAYADGGNPTFGGKIYKSVLINFVEERPYVDFVADFVLRHSYFSEAENKRITTGDLSEAEPSKAVSILVSVPEKRHLITVITDAEAESAREKCPCQA